MIENGLIDAGGLHEPYLFIARRGKEVASVQSAASPSVRKQMGRGRAVYLSVLEFDGPLPPAEEYF